MPSRNEEEEGETQDPPSDPEGGAPDLSFLICVRATRPAAATGTYLINELRMKEECPQGLKPGFLGLQMSELKLRPPRTIYEMAWLLV